VVGITYFLIRIVGKYGGAFVGCKITKKSKKVTNYLGLALIPQAGVAIGLAFMGERMLPAEIGSTFLSIILCSSVLYEMTGPLLAKFALFKSGAIEPSLIKNKDI
ncbi:MAG TPA: cation/H(+) antiporter, partial [Firmicutes bacterium]|nr:cation/H(+) antiporter [Bacillota bacterium]